jgi:hypothetical protein
MGLSSLVRAGVALAHSITNASGGLQGDVVHHAWTANAAGGAPTWGTSTTRRALIEKEEQLLRLPGGKEVLQRAKVTFLHPITANGAANRHEPIDPRDKIVLPDGTTGPILLIKGLVDPTTGYPYLFEVSLG